MDICILKCIFNVYIENHKQHLHVFNIYCFIFYNNAQNYTSVVHIISWGKGNL